MYEASLCSFNHRIICVQPHHIGDFLSQPINRFKHKSNNNTSSNDTAGPGGPTGRVEGISFTFELLKTLFEDCFLGMGGAAVARQSRDLSAGWVLQTNQIAGAL